MLKTQRGRWSLEEKSRTSRRKEVQGKGREEWWHLERRSISTATEHTAAAAPPPLSTQQQPAAAAAAAPPLRHTAAAASPPPLSTQQQHRHWARSSRGLLMDRRGWLCCTGAEAMELDARRWVCIQEGEESLYTCWHLFSMRGDTHSSVKGKERWGDKGQTRSERPKRPKVRHPSERPLRLYPDLWHSTACITA